MLIEDIVIGCIYMIYLSGFMALLGIGGMIVEWYCDNHVLIKKKARKIGLYIAKYALIPVVLCQKKYSLRFWMSLKVKDC